MPLWLLLRRLEVDHRRRAAAAGVSLVVVGLLLLRGLKGRRRGRLQGRGGDVVVSDYMEAGG